MIAPETNEVSAPGGAVETLLGDGRERFRVQVATLHRRHDGAFESTSRRVL
jgi:hypothetical protein